MFVALCMYWCFYRSTHQGVSIQALFIGYELEKLALCNVIVENNAQQLHIKKPSTVAPTFTF